METATIWIISIAILIIVVIIIIVVALNNSESTPQKVTTVGYGEVCSTNGSVTKCDINLTCVASGVGATQGICRKNIGQACTTDLECNPNSCANNICVAVTPPIPINVNDILVAGFGAPPDYNGTPLVSVISLVYDKQAQDFDYLNFSNQTQFYLPDIINDAGRAIAQIPKDSSNDNYKFFFNVSGDTSSKNPVPNYSIGLFNINFQPTIITDINSPIDIASVNLHNLNLNTYSEFVVTSSTSYAWSVFFNTAILTSKWASPNIPFIVTSFNYNPSQSEFDIINCVRRSYNTSPELSFSFYLPKIASANASRMISQIPKDNSNSNYNFFFNTISGDKTSVNPVVAYPNDIFISYYNFNAVNVVDRDSIITIISLTFYNRSRNEYLTLIIQTTAHLPYKASWSVFYPSSTLLQD